jgi:hypothetical protein
MTRNTKTTPNDDEESEKLRILYIVTSSSSKYRQGHKQQNQDRLNDFVFPVLLDAVESLIQANYHVDLYLILSYAMDRDQKKNLRDALPVSVGLEIWTEAAPVKYACDYYELPHLCWGPTGKRGPRVPADQAALHPGNAQLARQHRFVVKDKLAYYDYFMAFEDDMRVTNYHLEQHRNVMAELQTLAKLAPTATRTQDFWGTLTKDQIQHMRPGFIRVEVLTDPSVPIPYNEDLRMIPVDPALGGQVDPVPCCHTRHVLGRPAGTVGPPSLPNGSDLVLWETTAKAMSVRRMPQSSLTTLDWVMLFPVIPSKINMPHFWAGDARVATWKHLRRPPPKDPKLMAQSAGWIASRQELLDLNRMCHGGFLPPFRNGKFKYMPRDGLDHNVEFWSGGIQMSGDCHIQRILPLGDAHAWSRHLLHHTPNVKQLAFAERMIRIQDFMGQMSTVQQVAQRRMQEIQQSRKQQLLKP